MISINQDDSGSISRRIFPKEEFPRITMLKWPPVNTSMAGIEVMRAFRTIIASAVIDLNRTDSKGIRSRESPAKPQVPITRSSAFMTKNRKRQK
jgi:hypothetical protein